MCLSKIFIDKDGKRELLMSEIALVQIEDGKLRLRTLFGEQKEIGAKIREIDLVNNSILLENVKESSISTKK